jgi:type II secretory pathway pseudopilin PulG
MTLVELLVSMLILGLVLTIFLTTLVSVQAGVSRQTDRSESNDQARLAAEELDREIRSGNLLYDPSLESDTPNHIFPGMSLRIYSQTNANIRNPGNRCEQWRIYNEDLWKRDWTTTWRSDGIVSTFRIVAEHVVNQTLSPQVTAFSLDPDPNKAGRTLVLTLKVDVNAAHGRPVTITQSVTGRNTQYGYPNNVCSDIPPYSN